MSDNQHTPGPWKWKGEAGPGCSSWDVGDLINNNGLVVFQHEIDNSTADEYGFGLTTQANARLIAAAPDLLTACKGFIDAAKEADHGADLALRVVRLLPATRDAIAKATGEPT